MTSLRSPDFQQFLTLAEATICHTSDGRMRAAAERMFAALRAPAIRTGQPQAA